MITYIASIEYNNGDKQEVVIRKCKNIVDANKKLIESIDTLEDARIILIKKPISLVTIDDNVIEIETPNNVWGSER